MPTPPEPPLRRFEVAERSMSPTLEPGDYLVARAPGNVRPGDLVAFRHPRQPERWLVKRVETVGDGTAWVVSDNREATLADSRSFGPVPVTSLWRVILRYWPPRRITLHPGRVTPRSAGPRSG